ncbi:MAG TPA: hypothetical protein VGW38_11490 [Chloroflexota bacterium]|nr:hypothetical protein [Chloroflexota bacterium]
MRSRHLESAILSLLLAILACGCGQPSDRQPFLFEKLSPGREQARAHLHLVKKVRQRKRIARDEEGRPVVHLTHEVELYDAQGAARDIRRAHGAYGPSGSESDPLHVRYNLSWSSGPPSDGDDA